MRIRREQMDALRAHMARQFEDRLVADVHELFPKECSALGAEGVREQVRGGCAAAEAHGFETEADVARYVYLMFALCPDFDTSPRYPWAAAILSDEALEPPQKIDALYDRAEADETPTPTPV